MEVASINKISRKFSRTNLRLSGTSGIKLQTPAKNGFSSGTKKQAPTKNGNSLVSLTDSCKTWVRNSQKKTKLAL